LFKVLLDHQSSVYVAANITITINFTKAIRTMILTRDWNIAGYTINGECQGLMALAFLIVK